MYVENILDLIGNTPLISLKQTTGLNIFAKAEFLNPGGSIKDRIAKNMLDVAEAEGKGASKWGKLKSGAGWISLDYGKRV